MEILSREQIIDELQQSFQTYIEKFGIEDIGIFEEEGQNDRYYLGYTVRNDEDVYHIHMPYTKNRKGGLSPLKKEWTVESDDPQKADLRGYRDIESVFHEI